MTDENADRICLITGASSGIGLETARGMAARGFRVVLQGRNPERTPAAAEEVRQSTGNPHVEHLLADFSSLDAVRGLAEAFRRKHDRLDVLINNAGLYHPEPRVSADGFEETFAVNHLAPFLLTDLLLEALAAAAPSRVIVVSSRYHAKPKTLDVDALESPATAPRGLDAYKVSKLCNVLFANELARRVADRGITAHSVHPGDVSTGIMRNTLVLSWLIKLARSWLLLTPEQGARTTLHAATADHGGRTGLYFAKSKVAPASPLAADRDLARRLWELSARLVGTA